MKNLILTGMLVLGITVSLFAQEIPFVFDKSKIDVGTMYVYDYSVNKKDFEPGMRGYFYIKTLNDIEVLWIPIKDTIAISIDKYKMNWNYMMLEKERFFSLKKKSEVAIGRTFKNSYNIDFSKKILRLNHTNRKKNGFKEFTHIHKFTSIPTYFYNLTDLVPLWFALRFYPLDKKEISVNSYSQGYNITLDIKYIGKEEVEVPYGKVLCHKFELVPQMSFAMKIIFKPKKAWIWLTSEDNKMYMVRYRNNNVKNSFTRNMEYRLADIKKMTPEEWEKFKEKCGVKSEVSK